MCRLAQRQGGVTEDADALAQAFKPLLSQMLSALATMSSFAPDVSHPFPQTSPDCRDA